MYDPQVAGLAALFARLDSKEPKPAAPEAAKPVTPEAAPAKAGFRDGQ